jgi:hypothetical protein
MSVQTTNSTTVTGEDHSSPQTTARSDFFGGLVWMGLGLAILIGSITMDRLEAQGVNPYTIPGLMPGLLGIAMLILGSLLAFRSWKMGLPPSSQPTTASERWSHYRHLALVLALCLTFGVILVGHGVPFWLASAMFVSTAIPCLQGPQRRKAGLSLTWRSIGVALAIGLGAGGVITMVFQKIFLVHLP